MGNFVCKSNTIDSEWSIETELDRLADRHHVKSVVQLLQGSDQLHNWHECFLQIELESGNLTWNGEASKDMRNLIKVECMHDLAQTVPSLTVVDGIIIRQKLAHDDMRKEIDNPRVLLFLEQFGVDLTKSDGKSALKVIQGLAPDVVVTTGRVEKKLIYDLKEASISLISEVDTDTLSLVRNAFEFQERVQSKDGVEYITATCKCFTVLGIDGCDANISSDLNVYQKPCCKIEMNIPVSKTMLLSHSESSNFAVVSEVARVVMLGICWKYLEISFFRDYFSCQDEDSGFQEFVLEIDEYLDLDLQVNPYSILCTTGNLAPINNIDDFVTTSGCYEAFEATTFCFNPGKPFLCESPHSHRVEMYSSKDLSINEYMIEAAPRHVKCNHPNCGHDACIHKRTFVANDAIITISSIHLNDLGTHDDTIYAWIEHGQILGTKQKSLSPTTLQLSIAHLLRLMICGHFSSARIPYESKSFCLKRNDVVMTFCLKPIKPYTFITPSQGSCSLEKEDEPNWMLNELETLTNSLKSLEASMRLVDTVKQSEFQKEIRVLEHLQEGIEDLRKKLNSSLSGNHLDLQLHFELDNFHYLLSSLSAVLVNDEDSLHDLGIKQMSEAFVGKTDAGSAADPCLDYCLHAGNYDIDKSSAKPNSIESNILHDIVVLSRASCGSKDKSVFQIPNDLEMVKAKSFLWDGEHWRYLSGDIQCSIISCFLSSRIYHDFIQQALIAHEPSLANWKKALAFGSPETCQIIVGNTTFESIRAVQFHALRESYVDGGNISFLTSLRNCQHWSSSGGKSNVYFAKSSDNRYIIKQITPSEKASFTEFAGDYFELMVALEQEESRISCLARILGMFKISRSTRGKRESFDLVVMENVFYSMDPEEAYDLKGLPRELDHSNLAHTDQKVLVDGDLRSKIQMNPLFVSDHSLDSLSTRIKIDTGFLSNMNVMDYSLLMGINRKDRKIIVGIIDYLRGYTLDKHIESWVKLLKRPGEDPTVISPHQYATRFQKQIIAYFTRVPSN